MQASSKVDGKRGDSFCSSTARVVLAIASIVLLFLFLATDDGVDNIKDLSDTVMNLTQQLQDERTLRHELGMETLELQNKLEETDIELAWEKQHVENQIETEKNIADTNQELRQSLNAAVKQLAEARAMLPAAPSPQGAEASERKLRGVSVTSYQPGDNVEIIERREDGKIGLHPGIVADVNPDGTYNLIKPKIKPKEDIMIHNQGRDQFQIYHVYPDGTKALYEMTENKFVPVTIVGFLRNTSEPGFEIHGSYQFIFDRDQVKVVTKCWATQIHRLVEAEETTGTR